MIKNKPAVSLEEVIAFVKSKYGLDVSCLELDGERDQNLLLTARDGVKYVFKIINPEEDELFIRAQNDALEYLSGQLSYCPGPVKDLAGEPLPELITEKEKRYLTRMLYHFSGKPMGDIDSQPTELIYELGHKLGEIDTALAAYPSEGFKREFIWNLCDFESVVERYRSLVDDNELGPFIDRTVQEYHEVVKPVKNVLRHSVIHNDANDYNIIVSDDLSQLDGGNGIKGFIDFGDMVYSYTAANPAVAIAYLMLDKEEPMHSAAIFLKAYNKSFKLEDNEIGVIFTMAKMRLALSLCIAASQRMERPDDTYLAISQDPIRKVIPCLDTIDPSFAVTIFREACGFDPDTSINQVTEGIRKAGEDAYPVLGTGLISKNCMVLNLGVEGDLIEGDPLMNTADKLGKRINHAISREGKEYGVGRYGEARILYASPVFQAGQFNLSEDRTIHLGMDIFAPEGTRVHAPADGIVHLFSYKPGKLDYGNMIILKHRSTTGAEYFSLYGHLSGRSIEGLEKGLKLSRGETFAWIGNKEENGGWSPHLHFQLITDLLGYGTDFPGVCKPWETEAWKLICPDPNIFLGIPHALFPGEEKDIGETLKARKEYFGDNLSLSYKRPLKISRGWMQYLYDQDGQRYLDAYNNVPHIGHCHPELTEAAFRQMRTLNTNTRYLSDHLNAYAELLLSTFSKPLEVCFFLNSASEANELALRLAFNYTGMRDVIVLEGAYHGNTSTLIDISPYKHDGPGGRGAPHWVHCAPVPDCYRGRYKYEDPGAGSKYAYYVAEIVDSLKKEGQGPAAFIAETCPSVGGQIILPGGYLDEVYRLIRAAGGVCIADEVQTAYGRMGTSFYAFERQNVVPDIVVLGKPIGNGHPLAAVVTTREIADAFNTGMEFFSTFGGNTVSSVVGRKTLEIVIRDRLMDHARDTGDHLINRLNSLKGKHSLVGDVRGSGLFIGVELVKDHASLEPATAEAAYIKERLKDYKILIGTDGPFNNVLKIRPPMPFDTLNAEILADRLASILEDGQIHE